MFGLCNIFARTSTIFSPMVAEIVPQPILLITMLSITAAFSSSFLRTPEKIGSFSRSGKKGKIEFVQDSAVEGKDFHVDFDKKPSNGVEEVKKELFLLEEDDDAQNHHDESQEDYSDKNVPQVAVNE